MGFDMLTTCQTSTVCCSRERLPAAAAQPAKVRQSCSTTDYYYYRYKNNFYRGSNTGQICFLTWFGPLFLQSPLRNNQLRSWRLSSIVLSFWATASTLTGSQTRDKRLGIGAFVPVISLETKNFGFGAVPLSCVHTLLRGVSGWCFQGATIASVSNSTRDIDVSASFCVVLSCVGRGFAMGETPSC
jgi:hypothetical protein